MAKTPAWQRKEGKNPSGGLNAKGRASYKGGTLKPPSKTVGNPRRASFCARMKGMKKKLTSKWITDEHEEGSYDYDYKETKSNSWGIVKK